MYVLGRRGTAGRDGHRGVRHSGSTGLTAQQQSGRQHCDAESQPHRTRVQTILTPQADIVAYRIMARPELPLSHPPFLPLRAKRAFPASAAPLPIPMCQWSLDHGDGNTRRLPLWSAVDRVPREVRSDAACDTAFPHPSGANFISFTSPKLAKTFNRVSPEPTAKIRSRSGFRCRFAAR